MIIMALDHVRDYVHYQVDPTDLTQASSALFLTRWITHFCAPVFMLLAGTGAYLQLARGTSKRALTRFLVTRGLWLIFLELTVVRSLGWFFNFDYHLIPFLVIWALGASMLVLAVLIWLPTSIVLVISVVAIAGHNLLDNYTATSWVWNMLHEPTFVPIGGGHAVAFLYVLVPWVFVMALGFALGPVFTWPDDRRRRTLLAAGAATCAAFVVIRAIDVYGDSHHWTSPLDFLNCTKYPPSLDYLLMTLGPALVALALFERWQGRLQRAIETIGRVPMFYYLLHIPLIHGVAVALALASHGSAGWLFSDTFGPPGSGAPAGYGFPLWVVYAVWLGVVLALYLPCRWYADYKRSHRQWWLSYV
jgi:uncharacterized membrane protein